MTKSHFCKFLIVATLFSSVASITKADILFEGYYKVSQFKKHIGFFVVRNEVDPKTKQFITTSYTRLAKNGFDMTETLHTVSDSGLIPISYSYLGAEGKKTKTIDATFKKDQMTAQVNEDGKSFKVVKKLKKGTFLSSILYYLMLNSKDGLKTDSKYDFEAVAEEVADVKTGSAKIDKKLITQGSLQLLKVTNSFAGSEYENLITDHGEAITAITAATGIETELVKSNEEATEGIKVNSATLEKLFGSVPTGKINVYHAKGK